MYSYNNSLYGSNNTYPKANNSFSYQVKSNNNDDRFVGPFLGPLLLGGIAGYALRPPYPAPYPVPIYPVQGQVYYPYNNPNTTYTSNSYYY